MIKQFLIVIIVGFSTFTASAQEPVLDRDVEEERENSEKDRFRGHFRFGINVGLDENPNLQTELNSFSSKYGGAALFRAAKFYTFGITYGVQSDNYRISQDTLNLLAPGVEYDKQHLRVYTGRIGIRNRFHLSKHGAKEGTYIEFGAEGSIKLGSRMRIQNELDPKLPVNNGAEELDAVYKKLQFTELLGYYGTAAIGRNGICLYGEYRLTELFKRYEFINNNELLPNIAPLNVGLRIEF